MTPGTFVIIAPAWCIAMSPPDNLGQPPPSADSPLRALYEDYWQYTLQRHPERATYLSDHRYDDALFDFSEAAHQAELEKHRALLVELRRRRSQAARLDDPLSPELLERTLQDSIDLGAFPEQLMPIKQQNSPQISLGMIQTYHPFKSPKDCENYAARLRAFGKQVTDMRSLMDEGIRGGVVRPRITIEQALPQIEAMITENPQDCLLYKPAKSLPESAGGVPSCKLIEDSARDAMRSLTLLRDYLQNDYLPKCRDTVGYCHLPNGKAWYRRLAKHHTTTDLTPEQIHHLGLDELELIHERMRAIAREVGFDSAADEGYLPAFIRHVRNDPTRHNKNAEEIVRRHRDILACSDANLPRLFGVLPRTPYELKEIESFCAPSAAAGYYHNAPDDGSRPAFFYVNTYKPETRPIYTMEALAYHEAMPGHHLQLAIAQEKKHLPAFRRFEHINAFIEGWALYSERLGHELGGYRDPYSRFGLATFDAWRSARLVVDTGLHYFGWTRDRAIQFMKDNTALSEQDIVSEVDRYIAWPGQALAYKIGQLEILRIRQEAEAALGDRFDIRAFHDHLLAEGSLPLTTLSTRMASWVTNQQAAKGK